MNLKVVYKVHPQGVLEVLSLLREQGLAPVALDNPDGGQKFYSGGTYRVRIAVPENEVQQATEILAKWEDLFEPEASEFQRDITKQILISLIPVSLVVAVLLILGKMNLDALGIVSVIWLILFFIIGYIYRKMK